MTASVAELESTVNEHQIESDNLNDEIIGNPEQLFADIDHAKSELKNTNESVAHFKRQLREQEHLRREADAIRDKLHAAHAEFDALIKTNLDRVSKCRAEAAKALEDLKQKETRVLAMQREHDEFRAQCDNENLTLRDSIKVGEEKILSVCRQSDTYLQNAEELERYDFAVDERAKTAHLKQVRDGTAQAVAEKKAYVKRCLKKENALQDKVIDVENRYNHLVKFVDKCVSKVENYPGLMDIQKAQAYISELENKKMKLQKRVNVD
uniref:TACC_C domain-containing protein n=1 Tax=Panagrellus redivivus TaxID=6233 RepID=A0A7E4ZVU7_PANRE